jgi:hypothetical protein
VDATASVTIFGPALFPRWLWKLTNGRPFLWHLDATGEDREQPLAWNSTFEVPVRAGGERVLISYGAASWGPANEVEMQLRPRDKVTYQARVLPWRKPGLTVADEAGRLYRTPRRPGLFEYRGGTDGADS